MPEAPAGPRMPPLLPEDDDPPVLHAEGSEALPRYAELHCLSNFSFLRGASHPEQLVARAAELERSGS